MNQKTLDLAVFKAPEAPVVAKRRVKKEVLFGCWRSCVRECRLTRMHGRVLECLCTHVYVCVCVCVCVYIEMYYVYIDR